jgi:hypothetical protein
MKRLNLLTILIICLMVSLTALLPAEKLARDVNGVAIQLSRYWTCVHDTIPAQAPTVIDSLAVPSDAAEAVIIFQSQAGYVRPRCTTTAGFATRWMYVPVGVPVTIPVQNETYIVYRSYTGANAINIVWKRM